VFVEVGANDPVQLSQTYRLEQLGWSGILIEPLAECADRLRSARRARVYEVAAGAPEDEGRELPFLVAGALSTLQPSTVEDVRFNEIRQVRVRTLDSILAEAGLERVDFLSVDVEGAELAVLRGFSIAQYRPRLILIEDDVQDLSKHGYLVARGYKLVRRTALNNWYVPIETPFPVSVRALAALAETVPREGVATVEAAAQAAAATGLCRARVDPAAAALRSGHAGVQAPTSASISSTQLCGLLWPPPPCQGPSRSRTSLRKKHRHSPPDGRRRELSPANWNTSAFSCPPLYPSV